MFNDLDAHRMPRQMKNLLQGCVPEYAPTYGENIVPLFLQISSTGTPGSLSSKREELTLSNDDRMSIVSLSKRNLLDGTAEAKYFKKLFCYGKFFFRKRASPWATDHRKGARHIGVLLPLT